MTETQAAVAAVIMVLCILGMAYLTYTGWKHH